MAFIRNRLFFPGPIAKDMSKADIIAYKNKLRGEIRDQRSYLSQNEATVARIRASESGTSYLPMLEKALAKITLLDANITVLSEKLERAEKNDFSEMLQEKTTAQTKALEVLDNEQKLRRSKSKKMALAANRKEITYQHGRKSRRTDRWDKKKFKIYLAKVGAAQQTLPSYMQENLVTMPNNKGYVWRGVYFFGKQLPEKNEPTIIFERSRGCMFIHKWWSNKWEKSKKQGQTTRVVDQGIRKKKFVPPLDWPEIRYADPSRKRTNRNTKYEDRKPHSSRKSHHTISGRAGARLNSWKGDRKKMSSKHST